MEDMIAAFFSLINGVLDWTLLPYPEYTVPVLLTIIFSFLMFLLLYWFQHNSHLWAGADRETCKIQGGIFLTKEELNEYNRTNLNEEAIAKHYAKIAKKIAEAKKSS